MEQAVQTASAHLPTPAPVGRRSPVQTRPLVSASQKSLENQEHRRGSFGEFSHSLIPSIHIQSALLKGNT